ncbi:unnamed protein product [Ostreobium quekettii]|uniref:Carboxypeptidase n=1 Tax=Ostreobium quekettii TaxID=121088 RepID=A0A8S1ISM2_9CHLO|nr:unnamed protein product [Ostreobium quekettii]
MPPPLLPLLVLSALSPVAFAKGRITEWPLALLNPPKPHSQHSEFPPGDGVPVVDPPAHTAGYFKLDYKANASLFYFFFESRSQAPDDPLVLWTNGGPGCASELGVFFENGPYRLHENMTLSMNPWGWDLGANMIFIDQPVGTGFSTAGAAEDAVRCEDAVAQDVSRFMWAFLEARPEFADRDFYVTGESYGGKYVPAIAFWIQEWNKGGVGPHINLKGLVIGNGLTDPAIQYGAYGEYALQNNLISKSAAETMAMAYPLCKMAADACTKTQFVTPCYAALDYCKATQYEPIIVNNPGIYTYDIRLRCANTSLCPPQVSRLRSYLNTPEIQRKLGVSKPFHECNRTVQSDMRWEWMYGVDAWLAPLLDDGIKVLIYAGDQDLLCNWVGNRVWVDKLRWSGSEAWLAGQDREWSVAGTPAGMAKSVGPLTFVKVYQAGHFVPMDQPEHAWRMFNTFLEDGPWYTREEEQSRDGKDEQLFYVAT